ncbi:MAG: molybdopterin-synthase adenylyltransferase MoeB [Gemmatimonadaceae bacterium]
MIDAAPTFAPEELLRYSRHLLLDEVGTEGQRRIKAARVLLIGAGGLGSPTALYLAAAGVGTIGLIDFDRVDESNLHRQLLHGTRDVGRLKVESARDRLHDVNPHVHVEAFSTRLTPDNALEIMRDFDVVIDGSDNFATRYLVNDAAVLAGKLNVYGSVFRFEGQASVFGGDGGPCYRCLFREPPPAGLVPNCAEAGVLGVLPGLIGTIQATEALKLVLGIGEPLIGRLLLVESLAMTFRTIRVRQDPGCPACGADASSGSGTIRSLADRAHDYAEVACAAPTSVREITPAALADKLRRGDDFDLIDVREPAEWQLGHLAGARLVPLAAVAAAARELDRGREIVLYCKSGVRSAAAAEQLLDAGFDRVASLQGGITRWRDEIDSTLPRY